MNIKLGNRSPSSKLHVTYIPLSHGAHVNARCQQVVYEIQFQLIILDLDLIGKV